MHALCYIKNNEVAVSDDALCVIMCSMWQSGQCRAMAWTAPHSGRISLQVGLVVR